MCDRGAARTGSQQWNSRIFMLERGCSRAVVLKGWSLRSWAAWVSPGDLVVVVQSLSRVRLFVNPWTVAHQASLSFTISQSLLKLMSIEMMMPSNHLILCHPVLLPPSIFPSITVFSNELALHIRWPNIGTSASVCPMNIQGCFPLELTDLLAVQTCKFSGPVSETLQVGPSNLCFHSPPGYSESC